MSKIRLTYHFNHTMLDHSVYVFEDPEIVLIAHTVKDVRNVLEQAESYAQAGYYVAGFLTYEAAEAFYPNISFYDKDELPYSWFGVFSAAKTPDPVTKTTYFETNWQPDTSKLHYHRAIQTIHDLIARGVTYQVNYTMRLLATLDEVNTDVWYEQLRSAQQADFTAHLKLDEHDIISVSPELFFAWDGSKLETRPMKGTTARGLTYDEDEHLKQELKQSEKEQAENVMIVDLLRNDVTRVAKPGTIRVPSLFTIETYPTVHQMTSTIEAETQQGTSLGDVFNALFPCGSITGAPKQSTMKHINQLELSPRDVYCGAIGMLTPSGKAVFNVPIRTVVWNRLSKRALYGVGGGVTWDSSAQGEYDETVAKSSVLSRQSPSFHLLETMLVENGEIWLEAEHLNRLAQSASYFQIPLSKEQVKRHIERFKQEGGRVLKLRLLLNQEGEVSVEASPINRPNINQPVALAHKPIVRDNPFLYHKTTNRSVYEHLKRQDLVVFDTLLWNEQGYLTEFTTGNLAYLLDGIWYTPPISDGLLPGTYRRKLMEQGQIIERSINRNELPRVEQIAFMNSVRGWIDVNILKKELLE